MMFTTQQELSGKLIQEIFKQYSVKISAKTFINNGHYRELVKEYLQKQREKSFSTIE